MSEEFTTGQASQEEQAGYSPLPESRPPEEETFSSDDEGIRAASKALEDERQQSEERQPRERIYATNQGLGEEVPEKHTIKADRAADDLTAVREAEAIAEQQAYAQELAQEVDRARMRANGIDPDKVAQAAQQPEPPQPQPDPEPLPPGVDPDIAKALRDNPKLAQALSAEVATIQQAQTRYAEATHQAAKLAATSMMAQFPELQGLANGDELRAMVNVIGRQNPARHAEIIKHAQTVQNLYTASENAKHQAEQQQRQVQAQQFMRYAEQNDAAFDEAVKGEPAETLKQVKSEIMNIARDVYGIDHKTLAELYVSSPIMRSAQMQRIFYDAAKYQLAMKGAKANPGSRNNIPPVQRPGTSSDRAFGGDESYLRGLEDKFNRNPTDVRAAAKLLAARRARG